MFSLHSAKKQYYTGVSLIGLIVALPSTLAARQIPPDAQAQIMRQAAVLAAEPAKLQLKSPSGAKVGATSLASVELLNVDGQPTPAKKDWTCEVSIRLPSGESKTQTVVIKQGESAGTFQFVPEQPGLTSIFVKPPVANVRSDKTEFIVQPADKSRTKSKKNQSRREAQPPSANRVEPQDAPVAPHAPRFEDVRFVSSPTPEPQPANGRAPASHVPVLHLSVNDVGDNFAANGKDAVEISALFESPDFAPAPAEVHIWLHWTQGSLDQQPLVIPKGEYSAKAHLTSTSPADVQVNFVSSTPSYQTQGDTNFTVHFVPLGATLLAPSKLSVVDTASVMLVFFGADNQPVSPGRDWDVTLQCKQSKLKFNPAAFKVLASSPQGSTMLMPISFGSDTIQAVVAKYTPLPVTVQITGWLVLGLCIGGGAAGGLAAYSKFHGSWFWRIFLGILVGALFCWLYVYLALPTIDSAIAHNTFSVFFIALLGGYLGLQGLDFVARKFGWI